MSSSNNLVDFDELDAVEGSEHDAPKGRETRRSLAGVGACACPDGGQRAALEGTHDDVPGATAEGNSYAAGSMAKQGCEADTDLAGVGWEWAEDGANVTGFLELLPNGQLRGVPRGGWAWDPVTAERPGRLRVIVEDAEYSLRLEAGGQQAVLEEPCLSPQSVMFRRGQEHMPGSIWVPESVGYDMEFFSNGTCRSVDGGEGFWELHPADQNYIHLQLSDWTIVFQILDDGGRGVLQPLNYFVLRQSRFNIAGSSWDWMENGQVASFLDLCSNGELRFASGITGCWRLSSWSPSRLEVHTQGHTLLFRFHEHGRCMVSEGPGDATGLVAIRRSKEEFVGSIWDWSSNGTDIDSALELLPNGTCKDTRRGFGTWRLDPREPSFLELGLAGQVWCLHLEEGGRRAVVDRPWRKRQSVLFRRAQSGEHCEALLVEGLYSGTWVSCHVAGMGDGPDRYNVFVPPCPPAFFARPGTMLHNLSSAVLRTSKDSHPADSRAPDEGAKAKQVKPEAPEGAAGVDIAEANQLPPVREEPLPVQQPRRQLVGEEKATATAAVAECLTKEQVQQVLKRSANSSLVLPLEHRYWKLEDLELFVMSNGQIRPKWCSIPDERDLLDTHMSDEQISESLETAAKWLSQADAILVGSGAGMGVNSGLATFRGGHGGVWPALERLGLSYEEVCDVRWFAEDPRLAWGFWLFCHRAYREAQPHRGYGIVRAWAEQSLCGSYSFTSNIDGHWAKSGWPAKRILECHGAVRWLQCSVPCCDELWDAPEDFSLTEDPVTHRAVGELPVCPRCKAVARPCVLMFGGDPGFSKQARRQQQKGYDEWLSTVQSVLGAVSEPLVVCLELGSGVTVPTVRNELARAMEVLPGAKLIRVNPENPGFPKALEGRAVSLPMDAMKALTQLDSRFSPPKPGRFIIHDEPGGGVELNLPKQSSVDKLIACAMRWVPWVGDKPHIMGRHIFQRGQLDRHLGPSDRVADELFIDQLDGAGEPPVTELILYGGHFTKRHRSLEARFLRVYKLLVDVVAAFSDESYQQRLKQARDRVELRNMIKDVHLKVLPSHGFLVSPETPPGQLFKEQQRMQTVIQSGDWYWELRTWADYSQEVSGAWIMQSLPPSLRHSKKR